MSARNRDSNMELLRIIGMMLIVLCHTSFCVQWDEIPRQSLLLRFGADTGVNCFVLISGYYMIHSKITIQKFFKLWFTVFTYSAGIYIILLAFNANWIDINIKNIFKFFAPFLSGHYWFASTYILLMIATPVLNKAIKAFDTNLLLPGIILMILINGIMLSSFGGRLTDFMLLYALAACIRLNENGKQKASFWFLLSLLTFSVIEGCSVLGSPFNYVIRPGTGNPLIILLSVSLFMGFAKLRVGNIPLINKISACAFGVYLIHCHHGISDYMWNQVFSIRQYAQTPYLIPYCIAITLIIYIVCTMTEMIRQATLERIYNNKAPKYIDKLTQGIKSISSKFKS